MKNALLVVSGVAIGLLGALVALASNRDYITRAEAQAGPSGGSGAGAPSMILGTGGATNGMNDLCWIVTKVKPAEGPERTVLALYHAKNQGQIFDLADVRMIDADLRVIDFEPKKHDPSVKKVLDSLPPKEREPLLPPRNP